MCGLSLVLCFKQNTAYVLRISVWSSDVCSSDLGHYTDQGSYFGAQMPHHRSCRAMISLARIPNAPTDDVRSQLQFPFPGRDTAGNGDQSKRLSLVLVRTRHKKAQNFPINSHQNEIGSPSCRERVCP